MNYPAETDELAGQPFDTWPDSIKRRDDQMDRDEARRRE